MKNAQNTKRAYRNSDGAPWSVPSRWWGDESFGGLPKGRSQLTNPKRARPFSSKCAMHLVFKSTKAVGRNSFRHSRNYDFVQKQIRKVSDRYSVKRHKTANVGNHLHLLVTAPNRAAFIKFTRRLAAVIACGILGGARARPREKFWTGRPFSRVVSGGPKAFWRAESYVILNELEAVGILPARALAKLGPAGFGRRMNLLRLARRLSAL